jgi:thiamine-monophosphate kinase
MARAPRPVSGDAPGDPGADAAAGEFGLIRRHFAGLSLPHGAAGVLLGIGDDCALLRPTPGVVQAVSTDMLVEGRHFLAGTDARRLGRKCLAVNLSDLAAMGADPKYALLALALPDADEAWVAAFAAGMGELARTHGVALVGGDTTRGGRTICITVIGEVPAQLALRRDAALAGDDVWVSGATGEAALGLACLQGRIALPQAARDACVARLEDPAPRVDLGGRLRGLAHAAIDVSDGLVADLGHILEQSGMAAELSLDLLPRSAAMRAAEAIDAALARDCLFAGGDDYELAFTAPLQARGQVAALAGELGVAVTRIGVVVPESMRQGAPAGVPAQAASQRAAARVTVRDAAGLPLALARAGWDHFAPAAPTGRPEK